MLHVLIFSLALWGCARDGAPEVAVVDAAQAASPALVPSESPADVSPDAPEPASAPMTVEALYAECERRVEGRESEGECASDSDCATAGCSQEVCVTAEMAPQVMSACEVKPCFSILDRCGCVEGRCSWSLKAEPAMELNVKLPPKELVH